MNNEPCVRFGMRISPKISEKPADRRNNRLPNVMLLTVSRSQKVMFEKIPRSDRVESFRGASAASEPGIHTPQCRGYGFRARGLGPRPGMTMLIRSPGARQHFVTAG